MNPDTSFFIIIIIVVVIIILISLAEHKKEYSEREI